MACTIRPAREEDCGLILGFIQGLAAYENKSSEVKATEALIREWVFEKKTAQVLFACEEGKETGFALYYFKYSTFVGRPSLHLEDLFVYPEYRGRGYGKALLEKLARIAAEVPCGRMEWTCLDWNQPSIDFYLSLGAKPIPEWSIYRLTEEGIRQLARSEREV